MISIDEAKERVERWADFAKDDRAPISEWADCDRERDEVLAVLDAYAKLLDEKARLVEP